MNLTLGFIINSALLGVGLAMDAFSVSLANGLSEPSMKKSRMSLIAGTFGFYQFAMPLIGWICVHTIAERFESFQKFIPWIALALLGYIGGKMLIEGIRGESTDEPNELDLAASKASMVDASIASSATSADKAMDASQPAETSDKSTVTAVASLEANQPAEANNKSSVVAVDSLETSNTTESDDKSTIVAAAAKLTFGALMIQGIATSIDALSVGFTIANYRASMAFLCALIVAIVTFAICMVGLSLGKKAGSHLSDKASILGGVILIGIGLEIFIKALI